MTNTTLSRPRGSEEAQVFQRGALYPATQRQGVVANRRPDSMAYDADRLTRLIWNHQEKQRLGFPTINALQTLAKWPWPRFMRALDSLLEDPESGVYITHTGGIGYTWELTYEDLRRCEARVAKLRSERLTRRGGGS